MSNLHAPDEAVTDSRVALNYLKEGNLRFVNDTPIPRDTNKADMEITKNGQKPFAIILTCADSRVSPEIYFDQKMGDIFVLRNAGNVADPSVIGSIEFAVGALGAPLIVVVGHSKCGAVYGAYSGKKDFWPALQNVLDGIRENVKDSPDEEQGMLSNVCCQVDKIKSNAVVKEKGAVVIGADYDLDTGEVRFHENC